MRIICIFQVSKRDRYLNLSIHSFSDGEFNVVQVDNFYFRVYKEDLDDETWELIANDKEQLIKLVSDLKVNSSLIIQNKT